jgi:hypothetical protein
LGSDQLPLTLPKSRTLPDFETIVWPNDADFSPDFLNEIGQTTPNAGGSDV